MASVASNLDKGSRLKLKSEAEASKTAGELHYASSEGWMPTHKAGFPAFVV